MLFDLDLVFKYWCAHFFSTDDGKTTHCVLTTHLLQSVIKFTFVTNFGFLFSDSNDICDPKWHLNVPEISDQLLGLYHCREAGWVVGRHHQQSSSSVVCSQHRGEDCRPKVSHGSWPSYISARESDIPSQSLLIFKCDCRHSRIQVQTIKSLSP